ncbi:unnamed protein product [Symbiodinium necroappetens]|uniref:Uncharacterized protein n=1 Tax=Symbiodinium necroappetens TaxID=1628268 RepID=A0A812X2D2_9DINO|nr:unnamed protein product [Symbiodinium necroappetens]
MKVASLLSMHLSKRKRRHIDELEMTMTDIEDDSDDSGLENLVGIESLRGQAAS